MDYDFFNLINHGVDNQLLENVIDESKKLFSLPLEEKMKLARKEDLDAENLDSIPLPLLKVLLPHN